MTTRIALTILIFLAIACKKNSSKNTSTGISLNKYTCPMHPQIVQDKPGLCPICGMALVIKSNDVNNVLMLSDRQIKLANIKTKVVKQELMDEESILSGRLTIDEQQSRIISSRVEGRIERLYVKEIGQSISKGQPLYSLYSQGLAALEQEYLLARENHGAVGKTESHYKSFIESAEKKLLLYGLTKNQINQLTKENSSSNTTFLSPAPGVITEINVLEGQSVQEGSPLFKIEDLTKLWVEAELYPSDASSAKIGDTITVKINGDESTPIETKISFLSPEYRSNTQLIIFRAPLGNKNKKYKPGQQAQVYLSHSSTKVLTIPTSALIKDSNGAHVYVQKSRNTYRPQRVTTGLENFDQIEIRAGIKEGDTVVISGAYLLYSEIILKKGAGLTTGHNH